MFSRARELTFPLVHVFFSSSVEEAFGRCQTREESVSPTSFSLYHPNLSSSLARRRTRADPFLSSSLSSSLSKTSGSAKRPSSRATTTSNLSFVDTFSPISLRSPLFSCCLSFHLSLSLASYSCIFIIFNAWFIVQRQRKDNERLRKLRVTRASFAT